MLFPYVSHRIRVGLQMVSPTHLQVGDGYSHTSAIGYVSDAKFLQFFTDHSGGVFIKETQVSEPHFLDALFRRTLLSFFDALFGRTLLSFLDALFLS